MGVPTRKPDEETFHLRGTEAIDAAGFEGGLCVRHTLSSSSRLTHYTGKRRRLRLHALSFRAQLQARQHIDANLLIQICQYRAACDQPESVFSKTSASAGLRFRPEILAMLSPNKGENSQSPDISASSHGCPVIWASLRLARRYHPSPTPSSFPNAIVPAQTDRQRTISFCRDGAAHAEAR